MGAFFIYFNCSYSYCRGGYIVTPESFEFWQGQTNRLHDRLKFRRLEPDEKINEECTHIGEDGWGLYFYSVSGLKAIFLPLPIKI
jgi:hypothetical protein